MILTEVFASRKVTWSDLFLPIVDYIGSQNIEQGHFSKVLMHVLTFITAFICYKNVNRIGGSNFRSARV